MACRLVGLSRSAYRRPLKGDTVADPDRALRQWLRAWAKDHPRYGYRRAYHDARAEGWVVNHKKIQRLWRDEGLRVPQRRRRKRVGSSTVDAPTADAPNVVWAVDFQFDADEHGRPIKICSIVDEHTRECIGDLVERSITADRLTAHLEDLVAARGAPAVLRSDNGPEFISEAMADWAGTRTGLSYIPPGSPCRLPNPSRVRSAVHPSNGNRRLTERPDRMKGAAHPRHSRHTESRCPVSDEAP
ncbi:hypothetical protein GCM10022241_24130 [Micrococcus endophyticus]